MLRVNKNRNRALKRMRQLGIVDRKKEQEARLIKAGRLSLLTSPKQFETAAEAEAQS